MAEIRDITQLLSRFDADPAPAPASVTALRPLPSGASRPWRGVGAEGNQYLVKYSWHAQERWLSADQVLPQRTVVKELLCGRLGQLFTPA